MPCRPSPFELIRRAVSDIHTRLLLLSTALVAAVLGVALAIGVGSQDAGDSHGMTTVTSAARPSDAVQRSSPELAIVLSPAVVTRLADGEDSAEWAARNRSSASMEGTYLPEMMAERGSQLKRWVDRLDDPIRVWIAPGDSVSGFRPSFLAAVREAFVAWEQTEVPVRFAFVDSAGAAEVRVEWADRLPARRAGLVHWWTDAQGWLMKANIVLAMQLSDDGRADEMSMHRMALHEIGHLLGLEHSLDTGDIMAPWVDTNELSARDRATARLLYTLPPGAISSDVEALGS